MAMTPKEQLEILTGYLAGEAIQHQPIRGGQWVAVFSKYDHAFNFEALRYRIKPKPLEGWTNVDDYGHSSGFLHMSHEGAIVSQCKTYHRTVHMREVVDE